MRISTLPMGRESRVCANGDRHEEIRARIRASVIARNPASGKTHHELLRLA
jgi:hypothetical protein